MMDGWMATEIELVSKTYVVGSSILDICIGLLEISLGGGDTSHDTELGMGAHCDKQGSGDNDKLFHSV